MIYLTSDTHFGHRNICGPEGFVLGRRHFETVEEMNQTIIDNWNAKVTQHDTVIHCGDMCINLKPKELFDILSKLHGNIVIIFGNHDSVSKMIKYLKNNNFEYNSKPKFQFHDVGMRIKFNKKVYYMSHYPMGLGDVRSNLRNFCGHIHEKATSGANLLNIGIDSPEIPEVPFGQPILFEEAVELVEAKWSKWRADNPNKGIKN